MRTLCLIATIALLAGCATHAPSSEETAAHAAARHATLIVSLEGEPRTAEDRSRDEARHTAETLAFARVDPGQRVGDMIIGGGFFTRALAAAVGPQGQVTAWQPDEFVAFQASYGEAVTAADALPNVTGVRSPIGAPAFPAGLDLVFTAQNYHDLHLQPGQGRTPWQFPETAP